MKNINKNKKQQKIYNNIKILLYILIKWLIQKLIKQLII